MTYLRRVVRRFGLDNSFAVIYDRGRQFFGLSRAEVSRRVDRSTMFLNVMGFIDDEELLSQAERRVFLDIDPGFGHMWQALGLHETFQGHDHYVTIAHNIGHPDCAIPTCGIDWVTTPQPVVLEEWPAKSPAGANFTSIASWRGPFGPIQFQGNTYGLRVHEFRKFVGLPEKTDQPFELALDIDEADAIDLKALRASGWALADPTVVTGTPSAYQSYIQESKAEFMVAKNMYVQSRSGWFSDRSICYLASGRPVLAQDTGLADVCPLGHGLLTYTTVEEAAAGVEEICGNYAHHARAARDLAEEYFDSDKVLGTLLTKLGIT